MAICGDSADVYHGPAWYAAFAGGSVTLLWKYRQEQDCRSPTQLLLDSSKLLLGAGWSHLFDLILLRSLVRILSQDGGGCEWAVLEVVLFPSLGMFVSRYALLGIARFVRSYAGDVKAWEIMSGLGFDSRGRFVVFAYAKQLVTWLCVILIAKVSVALFMFVEQFQFGYIVRGILDRILVVPILGSALLLTVGVGAQGAQLWIGDDILTAAKDFVPRCGEGEALPKEATRESLSGAAAIASLLEQIEEAKEQLRQIQEEGMSERVELELTKARAVTDEEALRQAREQLEEIRARTGQ